MVEFDNRIKAIGFLVVGILIGCGFGYIVTFSFFYPRISELGAEFSELYSRYGALSRQFEDLSGDYEVLLEKYEILLEKYEAIMGVYDALSVRERAKVTVLNVEA